jgi:hypothetical protein
MSYSYTTRNTAIKVETTIKLNDCDTFTVEEREGRETQKTLTKRATARFRAEKQDV